ncbi:hypothetical protein M885DRAFT_534542 [Pelagophyceae sp. CCMP2097]|nr:hypothetical protein M885DRAFT_534542 [Pelagophyceae sp. CCMP2097]
MGPGLVYAAMLLARAGALTLPRRAFSVALSTAAVSAPAARAAQVSDVEVERMARAKQKREGAADFTGFEEARGVKYQVVRRGVGPMPERAQSVRAEYTLTLGGFEDAGGKVVDSSMGFLKAPFSFYAGVGAVIKGWDVMVLQMQAGETRKLVIPPELGYGDKGSGKIPGGATLFFVIELVELGGPPSLSPQQEAWLEMNPI